MTHGPLKIAYVADGRMPTEKANGYQTAQMCQAMIELGHDVTLLAQRTAEKASPKNVALASLKDFYSLRQEIPLRSVATPDLIYATERLLRIPSHSKLTTAASLTNSALYAYRAVRSIEPGTVDRLIVRSAHIFSALVTSLPTRFQNKVLCEVHGIPQSRFGQKFYVDALKRAGGVISLTTYMRDKLIASGIPPEKIIVEASGYDPGTFELPYSTQDARLRLGIEQTGPMALYAGRFQTNDQEKGIIDIIKSAPYTLRRNPHLSYWFIGGPLTAVERYREIIAGLGLDSRHFLFLDRQPIDKLALYLKASDVLLMPFPWTHHFAFQMSPLKLFEYMSAKRPIVATKLPTITEILTHGVDALLAEPGEPQSIGEAVNRLLEAPTLGNELAEAAYRRVQHFCWKKRAERILSAWASA